MLLKQFLSLKMKAFPKLATHFGDTPYIRTLQKLSYITDYFYILQRQNLEFLSDCIRSQRVIRAKRSLIVAFPRSVLNIASDKYSFSLR